MTTSKFSSAGLLPLLLSAVLGCSSGGGGSSTLSDFCKQWADAYCQIAVNPCGLSMDTCTTYQTGQCMAKASMYTTGSKRIFTPGNTGDCINKIKSAYGSTNPISSATQASIDLACQYVFQGPGKTGTNPDSCTTQFDCAGSTNGSIICDATYHVCASKTTVSGTGACMNTGDVCSTNFYCAPNSQGLLNCTAEGTSGAGSACASAPCDSNSRCLSGTCMPLAQPGGSCSVDSDCMNSGFCDHYGSAPTCDDGIQFAKGSQTCTCIAEGMGCPSSTAGGGGQGGSTVSGTGGAAGGANGAAGATGTGGAAAGTGGSSGVAGSSGAAGAGVGGVGGAI
jgi:hypothetical protein